jgi:hypothetical protein
MRAYRVTVQTSMRESDQRTRSRTVRSLAYGDRASVRGRALGIPRAVACSARHHATPQTEGPA